VWKRFRRWAKKGVFERIFKALSPDPDFEYVLIDGTIVKVHRHGPAQKGDSKSGHRQVARRHDAAASFAAGFQLPFDNFASAGRSGWM
jgi:transposase